MEKVIDCQFKVPHVFGEQEVMLTLYKGLTFLLSENVNIKVSETVLRDE